MSFRFKSQPATVDFSVKKVTILVLKLKVGGGGVVDNMVVGSGTRPCVGSNPTTCRPETSPFVECFKVTYLHVTMMPMF
ncbi:hypothetical protein E2C01_056312 [Portunus trituberculatus]|uniref:Uncharacterized protein n=1 Tax=Portunus trituberculatus TaxID=210409 RepID=A0A5B7GXF1_PORTR|nr:hypothetical protein [Portunus trituberculatus]